jgi:hypothetical protein
MPIEQEIQKTAIAALQSKLALLGYHPVAESVAGDSMLFSSLQDKSIEVVLRLLNADKARSISINQRTFNYQPRSDLYIFLILYLDDMQPQLYFIPSMVFTKPDDIFLSHEQAPALYHFSTWEIKIFTKGITQLSQYTLAKLQTLDNWF